MSDLFLTGDFTLHSGQHSSFKIDCDVLSDQSIEALAKQIAGALEFRSVTGVPTGGNRLASALVKHVTLGAELPRLFVDDVLTTGNSINAERLKYGRKEPTDIGVVIFARGKPPSWVYPIFQMW